LNTTRSTEKIAVSRFFVFMHTASKPARYSLRSSLAALLLLSTSGVPASDDKLVVLTGHDAGTATDFVVFSLAAETHRPQAAVEDAANTAPPYVTFQCRQTAGKRHIDLFVSFGAIENRVYHAPEKPDPVTGFPVEHPTVALKMTFVGYTTSKPFKGAWAALPNSELQYRAPGSYSSNMQGVRYFLPWLASLPTLRITDAHDPTRSADFQTAALLEQLRSNPLCQP
jgi:hypothetical protein